MGLDSLCLSCLCVLELAENECSHSSIPDLLTIVKVSWQKDKREVSEQTLREIFSAFGPVRAVVMREPTAAKLRKRKKATVSALVVMDSADAAIRAAHKVKNAHEGTLLASVTLMDKVEWTETWLFSHWALSLEFAASDSQIQSLREGHHGCHYLNVKLSILVESLLWWDAGPLEL